MVTPTDPGPVTPWRHPDTSCALCATPILEGIVWCRACHARTVDLVHERFPITPTEKEPT